MTPTRPVVGAILAAGFGSRMMPLTKATPKPLLPFLNTPIIAYTLDHLIKAGVRRIGINLHHLGDRIPPVVERLIEVWRQTTPDLSVIFVEEHEVRGTAGGVAGIWRALGRPEATLVAINGDALMDIDLIGAVARHQRSGARATILTREPGGTHPGGVWADGDGRVTGLRDKGLREGTELDFMGVHLLEPGALRDVVTASQTAASTCMVADVYTPMLSTPDPPHIQIEDRFWIALDTPKLLLDNTRRVLTDPSIFPQAPLSPTHGPGLTLLAPNNIDSGALISAPIFAGALCSISEGARVGPFAVLDGVEIGGGARVRDAVISGMGRIDGQWEGCVAVGGQVAQVGVETC